MPRLSDAFVPHPALTGGHRMTVYAWARRRQFPDLSPTESRLFQVAADTQVLGQCHWQPEPRRAPTAILLHGLEGSSESHYMLGLAHKATRRGFNVVRLNQRNCGGTESLTPGLYHSGLTADPLAVIRELRDRDGLDAFVILGYSLGGNIALKLGGEIASNEAMGVRAVAAVSPPIELAHCVDALERAPNLAYHWNFLRGLRSRLQRKAALFPERYDLTLLRRARTVRAFDDLFTAPHNGFDGAADYYHRASARRVLERLAVPALLVTALDDPFVPPGAAEDHALDEIAALTRVVTRFGGHCGYVGRRRTTDDGYWAETTLVDFAARHAAAAPAADQPRASSSSIR